MQNFEAWLIEMVNLVLEEIYSFLMHPHFSRSNFIVEDYSSNLKCSLEVNFLAATD
jgi:hypothetical protein